MTALLAARGLGRSFGDRAVFRELNFEVQAGRHLALLGPSGCGKSTLLRVLAGLDAPEQGELRIDGQLVSSAGRVVVPPHRRKLAMVFQDLALWPTLSAIENVRLGLSATAANRKERAERARDTLCWCGLAGLEHRRPAALSIGQQQRVAIARALACQPALLLLDEPFSSLDWLLKGRLLDELKAWCAPLGTTLLLVTHDPAEAAILCEQALVFDDRGGAEHGPLATLLANPGSPFLQEFVHRGTALINRAQQQ